MTQSARPYVDNNALQEATRAVSATPELGRVTFTLKGTAQGGIAVQGVTGPLVQGRNVDSSRAGRFTLKGDEPHALLGHDTGVSPAEYILMGLAGCYTVVLTTQAAQRGWELSGIELKLSFDLDLRGFLGLDPTVRKGAQAIHADIHVTGEGLTKEQVEELVRALPEHSPIHDTLANPVTIIPRVV
ncbi:MULTISPECIES: OsmC family protein [unclassified Saccharibacter]|uniref:OsmC family protein n=1 Tax=unclassified Saccharibacter TaxID=2648722 RepID=UPI00132A1DCC|nr:MULTISPECIES: OsmC family protein [unclassified Saccharibacter]MXV36739.1 OsmC family peroxiredoxin [Saccharibacter sp. EH611]MXV58231.1 OsmC family peroxiredoxin [Saccharibacter sp. EH70]MXV65687.1 OsmC family peroxiredoxin [Saccharibacter sp. EH60]